MEHHNIARNVGATIAVTVAGNVMVRWRPRDQETAVPVRPALDRAAPDATVDAAAGDTQTARELAKSAEDRNLIEILEIPYALSRPYAAPPDVPADRAKALQTAFMATHKDPAYLADAEKVGIEVSPISGGEIRKLIEQIAKTPAEQLKRIENLIAAGG